MTGRVCFIGNSHLIMVQMAWETHARQAGREADFFAALIRYFPDLQVEDGRLVPAPGKLRQSFERSSRADGIIDPARYDRFVFVGMRIGIISVYRLLRSYGLTGPGLDPGKARWLMGTDLLRAWIEDSIESGEGFDVLRKLRSVTDKPILLVPAPAPAEKVRSVEAGEHLPPPGDPLYAAVARAWSEGLAALCRRYDLTLWEQPEDTLVCPGLTLDRFLDGAASFSGKSFAEDDVGHMNAEMGARVLAAASL